MRMKAKVLAIDGTKSKEISLPDIFNEDFRPDLIRRASLALRSGAYQAQGVDPDAGFRTSAAFFGRRKKVFRTTNNRGISRLPRVKLSGGGLGEVRRVPQSKGGRTAHPPKIDKILVEKINDKERKRAIRSAIAATINHELVIKRGHKIGHLKELPLVLEDKFNDLKKTKDVLEVLKKLQLEAELARGATVTIRAGRGTMRGRPYRRKRAGLIVTDKESGLFKALKNIPGFEIRVAKDLNADILAPGGDAGRLTIYTESSISQLEKMFR